VVVDSCSVRAKRGGALTGPNPTDRSKPGTKYHVAVATDGLPLGAVPSAAYVHDTRLFRHLLRLAQVACAAIGKLYADAAYDSAENRDLCRHDGIQPHIRKIGAAHGSGLGRIRCVVEHDCAWLLANKRDELSADVLKVGHHGSSTSSSDEFLKAVHPELGIISVGARNIYGHPSNDVLHALAGAGAEVLRTDKMGTIVVRTDGVHLEIEANGNRWDLSRDSARR
jgi:hypothetical protein